MFKINRLEQSRRASKRRELINFERKVLDGPFSYCSRPFWTLPTHANHSKSLVPQPPRTKLVSELQRTCISLRRPFRVMDPFQLQQHPISFRPRLTLGSRSMEIQGSTQRRACSSLFGISSMMRSFGCSTIQGSSGSVLRFLARCTWVSSRSISLGRSEQVTMCFLSFGAHASSTTSKVNISRLGRTYRSTV